MDANRYQRQSLLPMIGPDGQARLARAHAIVIGCGALGCVAADLLARAGVGTLTLIDRDLVEPTNLHRQTLFTEADAMERLPKAEAARRRLSMVNSSIRLTTHIADLTHANAERLTTLTAPPDSLDDSPTVLLDATDNFPTRLLLNDLAVRHGVPFIYAGAVGTHGALATILPSHPARGWAPVGPTPCLRCLMPEPPAPGTVPTCDTAGVLNAATSVIASLQAGEAIKSLLGAWAATARSLRSLDIWTNQAGTIALHEPSIDPACPCCAGRRFDHLLGTNATPPSALCGRNAVQINPTARSDGSTHALDLAELAERLARFAKIRATRHTVHALIQDATTTENDPASLELIAFADGRAIVEGTTDLARATAIYARYIGH